MSVIIKGMDMPAMCSECDFLGGIIFPDGIYTCDCPAESIHGVNVTQALDEDCRYPDCPLEDAEEVYMKHYKQGRMDEAAEREGHLIQSFNPD